jgi:putative spermidine/putrescine transport system permease protein
VLPYAYRALDAGLQAVDVRTLSEAARSLGAGWATVIARVVLPNIRSAVLSASFLSVALVLGEFTIANLLSRTNVQVAINLLGKRDPSISVAAALASLLIAFALLLVLSLAGVRRRRRGRRAGRRDEPVLAVTPVSLEETP